MTPTQLADFSTRANALRSYDMTDKEMFAKMTENLESGSAEHILNRDIFTALFGMKRKRNTVMTLEQTVELTELFNLVSRGAQQMIWTGLLTEASSHGFDTKRWYGVKGVENGPFVDVIRAAFGLSKK